MTGAIRMAHHVKRQARPVRGVQFALRHRFRQRPRWISVSPFWPSCSNRIVLGSARRTPERRKQRGSGPENSRACQPVHDGRFGNPPAQSLHVETLVQLDDRAADIARQPDLPHPAILAVHEVIAGGQSNLTGQVRHRQPAGSLGRCVAVARQFGDAIGQRGHRSQIGARQMGIRHPDADDALAKKHQFHQRKRINARLGQRAVFVKFHAFGDEVGPRKLAQFRGDFLGVRSLESSLGLVDGGFHQACWLRRKILPAKIRLIFIRPRNKI